MNAPPLARRMARIEPFHAMALLARARALETEGRSIVHMEVGEPDFATPEPIVEAGIQALRAGHVHYTPALGLPELREAIAHFYRAHYGIEVPACRVAVTPGASGALLLALGVLIEPGTDVLMTDPGYPCNRHIVRLVEGRAVGIPVGPETGYQLTAEGLQRHWTRATRAVLLASPSNPTGTVIPPAELAAIARLAEARGASLVVDEIYHGLVYGAQPPTALALAGNVLVVNSFSKYFQMTGWRLGWLVAPLTHMPAVERLAQNVFLAAPTPAQHAALAAFRPETQAILEARRQEFQRRRDYLLPALRTLGFHIPVTPQGAFYLYADSSRLAADSFALARDLLEQAGVAITPGLDFGAHRPQQHLRFAYTTSLERLHEGVGRLQNFVETLRASSA